MEQQLLHYRLTSLGHICALERDPEVAKRFKQNLPIYARKMTYIQSWLGSQESLQKIQEFNERVGPFDVLDLDFCGAFGRDIFDNVFKLFETCKVNKNFVMFVTHAKGREYDLGGIPELLKDFQLVGNIENLFTEYTSGFEESQFVRNWCIPTLYQTAFECAYTEPNDIRLAGFIAYQDKDKKVPMMQYFFESY